MKAIVFLMLVACESRESVIEAYCSKLGRCYSVFAKTQKQCVLNTVKADMGTEQELRDFKAVVNGTCEQVADVLVSNGISRANLELMK